MDYCDQVDAGVVVSGVLLRKAVARFRRLWAEANDPDGRFYFDEKAYNKRIEFFELLPIVEGDCDRPFRAQPWQLWWWLPIYGFKRRDTKRRLIREALLAIGRKNTKTTMLTGMGLAAMLLDGQLSPKIFSCASTGEQARITVDLAREIINQTAGLRKMGMRAYAHRVVCERNAAQFRAITSRSSTQDGKNPYIVIFDEAHAQPDAKLRNVMKSALGALPDQLFLEISTEGEELRGPFPEDRDFCEAVLSGTVLPDPIWYWGVVYALDEGDDEYAEANWAKANPNLGVSIALDQLRSDSVEARQKPMARASFRAKRCNLKPKGSADGAIDTQKWKACNGAVDVEHLIKHADWSVMAVDLADNTDLVSWRALWRQKGKFYTHGMRYVPEDQVQRRDVLGRVPYRAWAEDGWLTITEGETQDRDVLTDDLRKAWKLIGPQAILFDPAKADHVMRTLADEGAPVLVFAPNFRNYSPGLRDMEKAYIDGDLAHGGDPCLLWQAGNLRVNSTDDGMKRPSKAKSADKIDCIVTLNMCFSALSMELPAPKKRASVGAVRI